MFFVRCIRNGFIENNQKNLAGNEKVRIFATSRTKVPDYPGKFPARGKPTPTLPKHLIEPQQCGSFIWSISLKTG